MTFLRDPVQTFGRIFSSIFGRQSALINVLRPIYEGALARCYGERGIPWTINNVLFRISPRHRQLMGQNWEPEVAAFLSERLRPGDICIDIGANAGVYVLQLCHWTAPTGRVIAFEPNLLAREVLEAHIRMNGFENRVEVVPLAVSDEEGEAEFHFAGASGMSRLGEANAVLGHASRTTSVTTTTIDNFCTRRHLRPAWLLMDIEGYELHALRGAVALLRRCPALQLIVEMHPALWPRAGTTVTSWREFLVETGLRPVALMKQKDPLTDAGSVYFERT